MEKVLRLRFRSVQEVKRLFLANPHPEQRPQNQVDAILAGEPFLLRKPILVNVFTEAC